MSTMTKMIKTVDIPPFGHKHTHSFRQLIFGLEGQSAIKLENRDGMVTTQQGCIIPPESAHYYQGVNNCSRLLVVDIPNELVSQLWPLSSTHDELSGVFDKTTFFKIDESLKRLIQFFVKELDKFDDDIEYSEQLIFILVTTLQKRLIKGTFPKPVRIDSKKLNRFIDENLAEAINIKNIAEHFYMSESYFYRKFFELYHQTPKQYINSRRMITARQLLKNTNHSVQHIAYDLGFNHQGSLTRAYKSHFGQSPVAYRHALIA